MYTAHVVELPMIGDDDEFQDEDLATRVSRAWCVHQWDKAVPLVKLGRFEGIRAIGSGSFGVVFKVRDPELDREVALKLCKVASDADRERMLKEARMLAKLSHPNVVAIHEVGLYDGEDEYEGSAFIVMELVEGVTGRRLIESRPRWEDAVDFYREAALGLAAAHAAGIVHGDFKPSNVIRADRRTRVVDFGLGHSFEPEGASRHKGRGTLAYMAPELLEGGPSSPYADQWALCVALWETLERVRPFDGRSPLSLLESINEQRFNESASMPARLRAALRRGLAVEPSERWPDMLALAGELEVIRAEADLAPQQPRLPGGIVLLVALTVFGGVLGALAVAAVLDGPRMEVAETSEEPASVPLDPVAQAVRGYEAARLALAAGDVRVCYDEWTRARTILLNHDPARAAELSLELADMMAEQSPGQVVAAWIAVGAAESFESVTDWNRAAAARARARDLYLEANEPDRAYEEERCREINARDEVCVRR